MTGKKKIFPIEEIGYIQPTYSTHTARTSIYAAIYRLARDPRSDIFDCFLNRCQTLNRIRTADEDASKVHRNRQQLKR